jgi:2,3-bisphosphoglycerate-dependent phosphoglycerate mutase
VCEARLRIKLETMKTLYIVRHCKAEGQEANAPLTPEGVAQSNGLADLLANADIERIISSPYTRATQSIAPLSQRLNLAVELDTRLVERVLCSDSRPDWQEHLYASFADLDLRLEGAESSREAMQRAVAVVTDIQRHSAQSTLLVTHGNLMALLLKHFDDSVGFAEWRALSNPDVYRVDLTPPFSIQRL